MTNDFQLAPRIVGEWKSEGFRFSVAPDCVDCTLVEADFSFSYARSHFYKTANELFTAFLQDPHVVSPAVDRRLIVAGKYTEDAVELPMLLLRAVVHDQLIHAREAHQLARAALNQASAAALEALSHLHAK